MKLFGKKQDVKPDSQNMDAPVKVLGSGCKNCHMLYENTVKAAEEIGLAEQVGYITDVSVIAGYGVMVTPALVIHEKVVSTGKVLTVEKIKELLQK